MPLHNIPLCKFSYARDVLNSATFKYDSAESINKYTLKFITVKKSTREIDIERNKIINSNNKNIDKISNLLLYTNSIEIDKNKYKLIYKADKDNVYKTSIKLIYNKNSNINICRGKQLVDIRNTNININKAISLTQDNIIFEITKATNKELERIKPYNNIIIARSRELLRIRNYLNVSKSNAKFIERENIQGLNINNKLVYLAKKLDRGISKETLTELERLIHTKSLYKSKTNFIDRVNNKNLNVFTNKFVTKNSNKNLNIIRCNNVYLEKHVLKHIDKFNYYLLGKNNNKKLIKANNTFLCYKDSLKTIYKLNKPYMIYKDTVKNMFKFEHKEYMYKESNKTIYKSNNYNFLEKDVILPIRKDIEKYLEKDFYLDIFKINSNFLDAAVVKSIDKTQTKSIKDISYRNIVLNKLCGLNKARINIFKEIETKGLNKNRIEITKNLYKIRDLEVIKRWWVLGALAPFDKKILPLNDYNYKDNPLYINSRIRPYGTLIKQDKHPISYSSYIDLQGFDLNYGNDEIALSIEIMLEMVNIVGMIVQHSANQFVNASGQEAIEFIIEVIFDWLNMDTTIIEMQRKNSRKHYLRAYRWIRWESEKIWFKADKDHSMHKMMGLKYAGMLFAELLDYMKYHHFDIVPLWRNLKIMDIERQFNNRKPTNGDMIKPLDKTKGKRHYMVDTQNYEKKKIF